MIQYMIKFYKGIIFFANNYKFQLNQQSHSESEVKEDDNETEAPKSCEGDPNHEAVKRKKKKKKKKSGKHVNPQRSSEDNADVLNFCLLQPLYTRC